MRLGFVGFQIAFAGRKEEVGFDAMLLRIELVVASTGGIERVVSAALNDPASFNDEYLVRAPYGGQAMR